MKTLEEVAKDYSDEYGSCFVSYANVYDAFIAGAKWKEEQLFEKVNNKSSDFTGLGIFCIWLWIKRIIKRLLNSVLKVNANREKTLTE